MECKLHASLGITACNQNGVVPIFLQSMKNLDMKKEATKWADNTIGYFMAKDDGFQQYLFETSRQIAPETAGGIEWLRDNLVSSALLENKNKPEYIFLSVAHLYKIYKNKSTFQPKTITFEEKVGGMSRDFMLNYADLYNSLVDAFVDKKIDFNSEQEVINFLSFNDFMVENLTNDTENKKMHGYSVSRPLEQFLNIEKETSALLTPSYSTMFDDFVHSKDKYRNSFYLNNGISIVKGNEKRNKTLLVKNNGITEYQFPKSDSVAFLRYLKTTKDEIVSMATQFQEWRKEFDSMKYSLYL